MQKLTKIEQNFIGVKTKEEREEVFKALSVIYDKHLIQSFKIKNYLPNTIKRDLNKAHRKFKQYNDDKDPIKDFLNDEYYKYLSSIDKDLFSNITITYIFIKDKGEQQQ